MKRRNFIKASLLAPLAFLLPFKLKKEIRVFDLPPEYKGSWSHLRQARKANREYNNYLSAVIDNMKIQSKKQWDIS